MRFSLRLCIWLALLVGSVLGLVLEPEPWAHEGRKYTVTQLEAKANSPGLFFDALFHKRRMSPDRTREVEADYDRPRAVTELATRQPLCSLDVGPNTSLCFVDDDTIAVTDLSFLPGTRLPLDRHYFLYRRFPEWWWGIFYRPLFWIAVVVFFGTVVEFVSMRKRLRTG